ncbi:hypothetical protein RFI_31413 [Reticulomyxa filosa]|uniref:Uncharacterized protein n=1 Tax=Reticulomyxa filosa TaxID=46433 RepID=X6LXW4_RETFI|nr:hypothetical protein RFI_31413 [Reticulomyxa filosa]|eukprot:ETO05982.1 hypothetical protein RFI_31413 [Reticulomyxa filosa]
MKFARLFHFFLKKYLKYVEAKRMRLHKSNRLKFKPADVGIWYGPLMCSDVEVVGVVTAINAATHVLNRIPDGHVWLVSGWCIQAHENGDMLAWSQQHQKKLGENKQIKIFGDDDYKAENFIKIDKTFKLHY